MPASPRIFISYRRQDAAHLAGRLHDRLAHEFGLDQVFMDMNLEPGEDWGEVLRQRAAGARVMFVLIGPSWFERWRESADTEDWVRTELATARAAGVHLIPVLADAADWPAAGAMPDDLDWLARAQQLRLRTGRDFDRDIEQAIASVRRLGAQATAARRIADAFRYRYRSLLGRAFWFALSVFGLLQVLQGHGLLRAFDDTRDTMIQHHYAQRPFARSVDNPVQVFDIGAFEFSEYFGEESPLGHAPMSVIVRALRLASERAGGCEAKQPVGFDIDLSPGQRDERDATALRDELWRLATCRPVVLACPQAGEGGRAMSRADLAWLEELSGPRGATSADAPRIYFATTEIDSWLLRPMRSPGSMGAMLARLAGGQPPQGLARDALCLCQTRELGAEAARQCAGWRDEMARRGERDDRALIVPVSDQVERPVTDALRLSWAAPERLALDPVLVGASLGAPRTLALRVGDQSLYSSATVHGWIARNKMASNPDPFPWGWQVAASLAAGMLVAAISLLIWFYVAGERRFWRRLLAYAAVLAIALVGPVAGIELGKVYFEQARWLGGLGLLTLGVSLRAAGAGYEVLLERGAGALDGVRALWRSLPLRTVGGANARARLLWVIGELTIIVWGVWLGGRQA